jgi:hypothetical protein
LLAVAANVEASAADTVRTVVQQRSDLRRVSAKAARKSARRSEREGRGRGGKEVRRCDAPVVVDNDGSPRREERVEPSLGERMRVFSDGREHEQVDDIDDSNAKIGAKVLLEQRSGLYHLLREFKSNSDEDDVGFDALVD